MKCCTNKNFSNKSLPADVDVRIRGRVIQVPVRQPGVTSIIPVAAQHGKRTLQIPFLFLKINTKNVTGGRPPDPLKSGFKKPPAEVEVRIRGRVIQVPERQPGVTTIIPVAAQQGNSLPGILIVIIRIICSRSTSNRSRKDCEWMRLIKSHRDRITICINIHIR